MESPGKHKWVQSNGVTADAKTLRICRNKDPFDFLDHVYGLIRKSSTYSVWLHATNGLYLEHGAHCANLIGTVLYTTGNAPVVIPAIENVDAFNVGQIKTLWCNVFAAALGGIVRDSVYYPESKNCTLSTDALDFCERNTGSEQLGALKTAIRRCPLAEEFNLLVANEIDLVNGLSGSAVVPTTAIQSPLRNSPNNPYVYTGNSTEPRTKAAQKTLEAYQIKRNSDVMTILRYRVNVYPLNYEPSADMCRGFRSYRPQRSPDLPWLAFDGTERVHTYSDWIRYVNATHQCALLTLTLARIAPNAVDYALRFDPRALDCTFSALDENPGVGFNRKLGELEVYEMVKTGSCRYVCKPDDVDEAKVQFESSFAEYACMSYEYINKNYYKASHKYKSLCRQYKTTMSKRLNTAPKHIRRSRAKPTVATTPDRRPSTQAKGANDVDKLEDSRENGVGTADPVQEHTPPSPELSIKQNRPVENDGGYNAEEKTLPAFDDKYNEDADHTPENAAPQLLEQTLSNDNSSAAEVKPDTQAQSEPVEDIEAYYKRITNNFF